MKSFVQCAAIVAMVGSSGLACGQVSIRDAREAMESQPLDATSVLEALPTAEILKRESEHVEQADLAEPTMPDLMPGDAAPALDVAAFVKGAPISEFESGTAYLVDFWATWCGPCIRLMPHVSELQDKYEGDNFQVLAVSIWEQQEGDELVEHVTKFTESRDDVMRYTVAVDNDGSMAESWMRASGQGGIPTVMLVDRQGKIAWIGYGSDPSLDSAVEAVVSGQWDVAEAREERVSAIKAEHERSSFMPWYQRFRELAASGERVQAAQLAGALLVEGKATDPGALNAMAWTIVENEGWDRASVAIARELAVGALERVDWSSAPILDTLAWAEHRLGNHAEAVRVQEMAIEKAQSAEERSALSEALEVFRKSAG